MWSRFATLVLCFTLTLCCVTGYETEEPVENQNGNPEHGIYQGTPSPDNRQSGSTFKPTEQSITQESSPQRQQENPTTDHSNVPFNSAQNRPDEYNLNTQRPINSNDRNPVNKGENQGFRPNNEEHTSGKPSQLQGVREMEGAHEGHSSSSQTSTKPPHTSMNSPTTSRPLQNTQNKPSTGNANRETTESDREKEVFSATTEQTNKGDENEKPTEEEEEEKEVCFKHLGCFSMEKPWKSTLRPVKAPFHPERIATTLFFYSRENIDKQKNITLHPQINMGEAQFNPNKLTAIIVHGFANSGNATWMKDMKNAYLKQVDANVMLVDWGKGAQVWSYLQVAGNTRVVGKQLAMFVKYLIDHHGANPGKFHLIGHSLGAQICSYLAKGVPGIARLTALDPAQPGFEGFDKSVRLDKSDAEFVDVVHSDARPFLPFLGFGMIAPHGHVDFYMNGGYDQPGCVPPAKKELPTITNILDLAKYPVELISKIVSCPHGRAYEYLTESFNETEKCIFWGHKADVTNVLKGVTNTVTQGLLKKFVALSSTCSKEDCIPLGFATKKSPLRGSFVVTTAARGPYCISEPGIPPETPPESGRRESFIQKIAKKTKLSG